MKTKVILTTIMLSLAPFYPLGFCGEYIEKWDELPKYGLLPPDTTDIKSAERLIVLTIQANALMKGEWWSAHGLLGTSRMPQKPEELLYTSLGYRALFETGLGGNQTAMEAVAHSGASSTIVLGTLFDTDKPPSKSWIFLREHYLGTIGYLLESRFIYDKIGNYGMSLAPTPDHESTLKLRSVLDKAYPFYRQLQEKGFNDETLGDAIGIANALLIYDQVSGANEFLMLSFAPQIYKDTLNSMLNELKKGAPFYDALDTSMAQRGLHSADVIGLPDSEAEMEAIIKLVKEDFDYIEEVVKTSKATSTPTSMGDIKEKIRQTVDVWKGNEPKK